VLMMLLEVLAVHAYVAVSLRKDDCIHEYIIFCFVASLSLGGSANGGRIEKMPHC
jgi:hypothetical protein